MALNALLPEYKNSTDLNVTSIIRSISITCLVLGIVCLSQSPLFAQAPGDPVSAYVARTAVSLAAGTDYKHCNWRAIDSLFKGARVIMLGEFTHGSRDVSLVRNDLVRHLHEEHGFDVVLFESGIGEMIMPDMSKDSYTASQMTSGLIGPWRTGEFRELMRYIQRSGISIAGYDVQRTGSRFDEALHLACRSAGISMGSFTDLESSFDACQKLLRQQGIEYRKVDKLVNDLIDQYENLEALLIRADETDHLREMVIKTLENRVTYLRYMASFASDSDWRRRWVARDSMMAENIGWLLSSRYSGKKVIVVGHNFHIAKSNAREQVMGEYLKHLGISHMLHIGTFAGRGTYADNYGRVESLSLYDPGRLDIKYVAEVSGHRLAYLPIDTSDNDGGWLDQPIVVNDSFTDLNGSNSLVLSTHFDGILLLSESNAPRK